MKRIFWVFAILFAFSTNVFADDKNAFEGFYWNNDKSAIIELRLSEDSIEGFTVWGPPETQKDTKNPDKALQKRNIIGLKFLSGFQYSEKSNRWTNGKVYDPKSGKTYDAKMELKNGGKTLEMRGYIGISILGRTERFERVQPENIPIGLLNAVKSALSTG
ncbi:MAG: DUF2147 domain-containing protein [Kordiimonas sp.]